MAQFFGPLGSSQKYMHFPFIFPNKRRVLFGPLFGGGRGWTTIRHGTNKAGGPLLGGGVRTHTCGDKESRAPSCMRQIGDASLPDLGQQCCNVTTSLGGGRVPPHRCSMWIPGWRWSRAGSGFPVVGWGYRAVGEVWDEGANKWRDNDKNLNIILIAILLL